MEKGQSIESLLKELQPQIEAICSRAIPITIEVKLKKGSLFDRYRRSRWYNVMQRLKDLSFIGVPLLFIKRKILKWNL